MNKQEVIEFLEKFEVKKEVIDKFFENKHILKVSENIFLTKTKFQENQIYGGDLLYINLVSFLPSKFLLNFIKDHSEIVEIKNEKQALNFTYGKNLQLQSVEYKHFKPKYYVIIYKNEVLGYVEFKDKQFVNLMNIGQYLQEN